MGTKVQIKSHLPSYTLESRRSLSCYYEDNILSSSLYDRPLLNQANSYSLCDKEMLKRMMLEHEATFRKQVYELHRLYRFQKELMNEFKNRKQHELCGTSQTNLFAQAPSEAAEKIWQMPQLCALSSHAPGNDNIKSTPKYAAIFQRPIETKDSTVQKGEFSEPKITGLPRKKFDLHLPAEVYIDIDDDAIAEKGNNFSPRFANPSNITCNADNNTNVKLALSWNKADGCINGSAKLGLHPEDVPSRPGLADLNEPIEASSYVEEEGLTSSQVIGANSEQDEFQGHQLLSNSSILSKDLFMANHGNKQMLPKSVNKYQGEHRHEWTSSTNALGELRSNANGSHGGLCYMEFSVISQLVQEKPKISYEFLLPGQNKIDKWIGEKPSPGTEACKGFSKLPNLNSSGLAAPQMTYPLPNISHSDNSSITSLSISSCTKQNGMKNIPIEVQAHSSFNKYAVINSKKADATSQSPYNPSDSVLHVEDVITKQQNFKGDLSSCQNGFHQDLKDGISSSQTSQPVIISGDSSQRRWSDNLRLGNAKVPADRKCSEGWLCADVMPSLEPSWLRKKQAQDESADLEESASQLMCLMSDHDAVASASNKQKNKEKDSILLCCLRDSPYCLHVMEKSEASCSPRSKRILGFPISERNQKGKECYPSSEGIRNQINLKSSASCKDALKTLVILPKYEVLSPFTMTNFKREVPTVFDLEGLLTDTRAETDIIVEEHKQLNCNMSESASSKEISLQQTDSNYEALIREAAENLVLMSSLAGNSSYDLTCTSIPASSDTLHWFADFVSSTAVSAGISKEKSPCNYDGDDGLDVFEYMTLKLKEVKEEDFFSKLQDNHNYEDTGAASLLLTKPQRGQAKKRRQRRDFQKDILPGLASLSRHEVTEDLQTLGGLMKASGKSWQASSSRRKTNPKGSNWQARGRRRPRSLAITVSEIHIGSSTEEQAQTKQVISSAGILGWGRTTRRCQRQRLLPGDFSVPLV